MRPAFPSLLVILAVACGRPQGPIPVALERAPCVLLTRDSLSDAVTVGVPDAADLRRAPVPGTEAERLVFAQFYETLVRLDCDGRMQPGLAEHWAPAEGDGRRWRFTLRDNARFWDGRPVTSEDVVAAWASRVGVPAESLAAVDARTLSVVLASSDTMALRWVADPRFAISRPQETVAWPMGTGSYAITAWVPDRIEARPVDATGPSLRFRLGSGVDPRDLLDQGADLVVTDDREALAYAERREAFDLLPLPWAWTYVFVGESRVWPDDSTALRGLAGDAVRADVRPAAPPFWWHAAPRCAGWGTEAHSPTPGSTFTIAYPVTDPVARDIAARLVALGPASALRTQGLGPDAFAAALAASRSRGFITAIPRRGYASCLDLPAGVVVPLLDARSWVIARRGRVGVEVEWDGTPRLVLP